MTYIKNDWLTKAIQNLSPHKTYTHKLPNLFYLQILVFIVYIVLNKEKQMLKSENLAPKALKKYWWATMAIQFTKYMSKMRKKLFE